MKLKLIEVFSELLIMYCMAIAGCITVMSNFTIKEMSTNSNCLYFILLAIIIKLILLLNN